MGWVCGYSVSPPSAACATGRESAASITPQMSRPISLIHSARDATGVLWLFLQCFTVSQRTQQNVTSMMVAATDCPDGTNLPQI